MARCPEGTEEDLGNLLPRSELREDALYDGLVKLHSRRRTGRGSKKAGIPAAQGMGELSMDLPSHG